MTKAATSETGALTRSDVLACISHLRAFAVVLAGDPRRADELVCDTIELTFTEGERPRAGAKLQVHMFAVLHKLHYGAPRLPAQLQDAPSGKEDGLEPDDLLRIFGRLRDEQREALILTVASGLSPQQAAEVCDCEISMIESRVSAAWREMSRALRETSPGLRTSFASLRGARVYRSSGDWICPA